ncbi:MAG: hypothetical protein KJ950_01050 [Proteobacteria bacterium]|nr:hypothetical protein [Pseudomonadota bacterium]MBU1686244.1 hypothetical protein [Pseudomonadota bacterium]
MNHLTIKNATCFLLALFMLTGLGAARSALAAANHEQQTAKLLTLINAARRSPLTTAAALGLNPAQVLADLPELTKVLTSGLPGLTKNDRLSLTAQLHTDEMFRNQYYEKDGAYGTTVRQRLANAGYQASLVGETLGLLSFVNLITPDQAVEHLFRNMFLDELNPDRTEPRYLLNPLISTVGLAMGSGKMELGGRDYNAYLTTCDFASDEITREHLATLERELVLLINQARVKPVKTETFLEINRAQCPDSTLPNPLGLPPMISEPILAETAQLHATEMINYDYVGPLSPNGTTLETRIAEAGLPGLSATEGIAWVATEDYPVPEQALQELLAQLLINDQGTGCKFPSLYHPLADTVGVSIDLAEMTDLSGERHGYYLATVDLVQKQEQTYPTLMGVVYRDANHDGLYTPGEGVADQPVIYYGAGRHLRSDLEGQINSRVKPGYYLIILFSSTEALQFIEKNVQNHNVWFDIDLNEQ